jgi:hypothetical protein
MRNRPSRYLKMRGIAIIRIIFIINILEGERKSEPEEKTKCFLCIEK